jgi:hypothetical protein
MEETIKNKYLIEWINENYPTMIEGGNSTLIEFDYYDADKFANWIEKKMYNKNELKYAFEQGKLNSNICYKRNFKNVVEILNIQKK